MSRAAIAAFAGIPFHILLSNNRSPDWDRQPTLVSEHIPGSNAAFTQNMGWDHATLTLRVWFDRETDFRLMESRSGSWDILRLPMNAVTMPGDRVIHDWGIDAIEWDNVWLVGVRNAIGVLDRERRFECDLIFQTEVRL